MTKIESFIKVLDKCIEQKSKGKKKEVVITKDLEVHVFNNQLQVSEYLGVSTSHVSAAVKGNGMLRGWYIEVFNYDDRLKGIPVIVSKDGDSRTFSTIKAAANYIGVQPGNVKAILNGYRKKAKGYEVYRV